MECNLPRAAFILLKDLENNLPLLEKETDLLWNKMRNSHKIFRECTRFQNGILVYTPKVSAV